MSKEINWKPIEEALGYHNCADFMYMGSGETSDGVEVFVYKHSITRRYINFSNDGRT